MENLAHPAAVHRRHRGYKFVTNWCFSSKGTEKLARLVRGWTEHAPRHGIISDDISAMNQPLGGIRLPAETGETFL